MYKPEITSPNKSRIAVAGIALLMVLFLTACDDFYSDSLPTPDVAQPTSANVQFGDPEEVLVGGWVASGPNIEPDRAYLSPEGTSLIIEVIVPEEFAEEARDTRSQFWAQDDTTSSDAEYEFIVAE
ncbi:MAG: hypothetical protein QF676_02330 [Dehalococcoidia bacterium]|nr:hypothetical protein [Chloroflexota bacterium]MDP6055919.1 hypothetical protein [Dehalococcoidia bacterium]MDP7261425.1 hypothetical protein [Dehalococcoidia bacterium]|tara:strand:+ start:269 stop:646 length:378 start_codon:yes stop_codon:yes gene_type:complete